MRRELRYLGHGKGREHTVMVTEVRSVFNPKVLFGRTPVFRSEMFRGRLSGGEPFISLSTGQPADMVTQAEIVKFVLATLD